MSLTGPPRIFRREWKRNKPHLPKSTSLPEMQLAPENRPLFTCGQCGFSNSFVPLCLWCCWTSPEAALKFEQSTPLARRITAPARSSWSVSSVRVPGEDKRKMYNISSEKVEERHRRHQPIDTQKSSCTSDAHETPIKDKPPPSYTRGKSTNAQRRLRPQLSLNTLLETTPARTSRQKLLVATRTPISADCNNRGPGDCLVNEGSMSPDLQTRRDLSRCRIQNNNGIPTLDVCAGKNADSKDKGTHSRSNVGVLPAMATGPGSLSEDKDNGVQAQVATETISTQHSKHIRSSTWAPGSSPNRSLKRPRRPLPLSFLNPPSQPPSPSAERSESISLKKSSSTIEHKKSSNTIQLKHSVSNSAMNALRSLSTKPSRTFQSARLILDFSSSRPCSPVDDAYDTKKKHREFELAPSSLPQEEIRAFSPLREKGSSTPPPDRTLRRKKHISIFRSSAPPPTSSAPIAIELTMHHPSPQRQSSHSDTKVLTNASILPRTPTSDVDEFGVITSDSRPQTPSSPASGRLGSPTRPYYSAIRKNMPSATHGHSRPNSVTLPSRPVSCPPPRPFSAMSSSPSPSPCSALPSIPDAEIYPLPRSSLPPPRSFGFGTAGCSVSGETELRMALGEVRYKDNRAHGSLVGRVKKSVRNGLREMWNSTSRRG